MRWIGAMMLVAAACGPRAMMASGTGTGTGSDTGSGSGSGSDTGSDTGSDSDSASESGLDQRGAIVWSRLPSPHLSPASLLPHVSTVADARALVGRRERRTSLAVALELSAGLAGTSPLPARTEVDLIAFAQARAAWKSVPAIAPGDLVVFDRAVENAPASLVAVALGRDARGVIEMLYVARGVVRRGFVDPARPTVARDRDRRAVNTYLRHGADQPPAGTRYLAGELFAGIIDASAR